MTKREAAVLGCKMLAILSLMWSFDGIAVGLDVIWRNLFPGDQGGVVIEPWGPAPGSLANILSVLGAWLPTALHVLLALYLWRNAQTLARRIFPDGEVAPEGPGVALAPADLRRIALWAIGLLVIIQSAPALLTGIVGYLIQTTPRSNPLEIYGPLRVTVATGMRVLLALWLIWYGRDLAAGLRGIAGITPHYGDARDEIAEPMAPAPPRP